jgi:DNA-binding NtrC family response regulator
VKTITHVFIADDDPDDLEVFKYALKEINEDLVCNTAINGEDALEKLFSLRADVPDMIFLDLNMPKMGGKECLVEIKRNHLLIEIPVIIYSTSTDPRDIMEAMQLGASFFLEKPNRFDELYFALMKILFHDWKNN